MKNNAFLATGSIVTPVVFNHRTKNDIFYSAFLSIRRYSGTIDTVPLLIPSRLLDADSNLLGRRVMISGHFRSCNIPKENNQRKLQIALLVEELIFAEDDMYDRNEVLLQGYVCQQPLYRITPRGREIATMILAVPRTERQNDYIPLVLWGKNARTSQNLHCGDSLSIHGRIQSREYQKCLEDSTVETRIAYEVSAGHITFSCREGQPSASYTHSDIA